MGQPVLVTTILYFQQAHIVAAMVHDPGAQTRIFASIDLAVELLNSGDRNSRHGLAAAAVPHRSRRWRTAGGLCRWFRGAGAPDQRHSRRDISGGEAMDNFALPQSGAPRNTSH